MDRNKRNMIISGAIILPVYTFLTVNLIFVIFEYLLDSSNPDGVVALHPGRVAAVDSLILLGWLASNYFLIKLIKQYKAYDKIGFVYPGMTKPTLAKTIKKTEKKIVSKIKNR